MKQHTIEYGYCHCGCGKLAPIAKQTLVRWGHIKGFPIRFIHGHYSKIQPTGIFSPHFNGGLIINKTNNRAKLYSPLHHRSDSNGYVYRSILVAEKALGKILPQKSEVHHFNKNRLDDTNTNLVICEDHSYHMLLHLRANAYEACGNVNYRKCHICKKWDEPQKLYIHKDAGSVHFVCQREYLRIYHKNRKAAQEGVYVPDPSES